MRTRRSKVPEADSGLADLLEVLHKGERNERKDDTSCSAGVTLHDESRNEVDKLLSRVGERQAAAAKKRRIQEAACGKRGRKRKLEVGGDDALFGQRAASSIFSKTVSTADAFGCGALAKTQRDEEIPRRPLSHNQSLSGEAGEPAKQRNSNVTDVEGPTSRADIIDHVGPTTIGQAGGLAEDEFDWEEGDIGFASPEVDDTQGTGNHWNGEVTLAVESSAGKGSAGKQSAGKGSAVQSKPPQRRATAKDKEFAEMVHKTHLLCMLARGRIIDAACNDPLLQGLILSIFPPSLGLSVDAERANTSMLGPLVSWFMSCFRLLSAGEGSSSSSKQFLQDDFSKKLLASLQKQAGNLEEVAALSVAFLRALGFTTRYVMVLDVASLKPDAESLEASEGWEPDLHDGGVTFSVYDDLQSLKVLSLARTLAGSSSQQLDVTQLWNVDLDDHNCSPSTDTKTQDGTGRGIGRRQNMTSLRTGGESGGEVLLDTKSSPKGRGKGKCVEERCQKTGPTDGSHEVINIVEADASVQRKKGDDEFERQLAMAIAATSAAAGSTEKTGELLGGENTEGTLHGGSSTVKKLNSIKGLGKHGKPSWRQRLGLHPRQENGSGLSGAAVKQFGPLKHWAEVYCSGKGVVGGWVHVDAARGIVDGADQVETAAAVCRLPLRYVVAFAGGGAKDVTRRYVTLWSTVSALRVDEGWWDATVQPLKQLEAVASAGSTAETCAQRSPPSVIKAAHLKDMATKDRSGSCSELGNNTGVSTLREAKSEQSAKSKASNPRVDHGRLSSKLTSHSGADRSALEDMEMETKTFTEPLPTNQQAYKSHHLYVLEKWITKYQTLYPKGPILGYCAGHPVYPRTSVQILHTPDRWLREGFKVKAGEPPAKFIKASRLAGKDVNSPGQEEDGKDGNASKMTALYGKWQTDAWEPPAAVNGIVPKNERGQIDAWSEKCIPPGTVHLRFPRLVSIAKELGVDFAPAMVGFEIRKGRSIPVYEGIVVCEEFKDVILDVYDRQEEARFGELRKKKEQHAAKRWWQLLQSMATRHRLQTAYEEGACDITAVIPKHKGEILGAGNEPAVAEPQTPADDNVIQPQDRQAKEMTSWKKNSQDQSHRSSESQHVHHFSPESESYDEESGIRTKRCSCGFSFFVEDM